MNILGISAYYHDSAAAITINGKVVAAAQEEWFTRLKHDPSYPEQAIKWCLTYTGLSIDDLDGIVFYDKPFLKFERLLETYYQHAPKGLGSFIKAMPIWLKDKLFLKQNIKKELKAMYPEAKKMPKILFPEHHLSHAASAFYPSPFEEAAILTIDGVGEWATASICHGKGSDITILKELRFPDSVGLLYSSFTYFLGFKVNFGEYKLMGLAPYGNKEDEQTKFFVKKIKEELVDIKEDGSIHLKAEYFTYATGSRMVDERKWATLFGIPKREAEKSFDQEHCNLAIAIQMVTEEIVLKMAKTAVKLSGSSNLCLAGGVALNCVANGKLLQSKVFDNIWVQPASGDAGGALGAAIAAHYIYFEQARNELAQAHNGGDDMNGAYLGPEYADLDIRQVARKYKAVYQKIDSDQELYAKTADLLAEGNGIGWFQGRQEFGPRALGNRSILGDARNPEMQLKLNLKIKFRESFRPFAPSVLDKDAKAYFDLEGTSPYMLIVAPVQESRRNSLPNGYSKGDLKEKLDFLRSDIPSVTHVDYSARVQTVHEATNPRYYHLLEAFKEKTGYSLLVNTSFNVRGEPVVCTPDDAYRCFIRTDMDYLVMGNYLFAKNEQVENEQTQEIKNESFMLD